jgi:LPXTG-motif cell wall-anchored protein
MQEGGSETELPFYWASAVMLGNNAPIKSSSNKTYILLIAGIALLLIPAFYLTRARTKKAKRSNSVQ